MMMAPPASDTALAAPPPPPLTWAQKRRRGVVHVPDGLDADTAFKVRVIDAVARDRRVVNKAKEHQFRKVATRIVTSPPNTAVKRGGSHNSCVRNEDLVRSRLFVEILADSVAGPGTRSTIAVASPSVWKTVAASFSDTFDR